MAASSYLLVFCATLAPAVDPLRPTGIDVDRDGCADVVLTHPQATYILSGKTGKEILRVRRADSADAGIREVVASTFACVGDVDGDGIVDFAVGAPSAGPRHGAIADGEVRVISGVDARVLYRIHNPSTVDPFTRFGAAIVYLGDVDADGVGDFAVSAFKDDAIEEDTETGSVTVFSGRDGSQIHKLYGPGTGSWFSFRGLESPGDVDGDGVADLLISLSQEEVQRVLVSGRDGRVLWAVEFVEDAVEVSHHWVAEPIEVPGHAGDVARLRRKSR